MEEKVKEIVAEQLGLQASKIHKYSSFVDDLGADSLDMVELVMAIEDAFDIEVPDDATENISTVGDAIDYLKEYINE